MRILSINNSLDDAFRAMGHEVVSLWLTTPRIYAIQKLVNVAELQPDLFLQKEYLGAKVCFNDLDTLPCPKGFWSIDTHLNYYWQRYYGQLFDVFFTPHSSYISGLADSWLHPHRQRLAQAGLSRPWIPHTQRPRTGCFVGRQTAHRPLRVRLCNILQEHYSMDVRESLAFSEMLELYDQTRLLPNECIAFESNFRLMEGASCGCCLFSPEIGEDQDALLTPGKELVLYHDAAELVSLLNYYAQHPQLAEDIGHAAQRRVQSEHLPQHRAQVMLDTLTRAPRVAVQGTAASEALTMTIGMLCMNNLISRDKLDVLLCLPAGNTLDTLLLTVLLTMKNSDYTAIPALLREADHILSSTGQSEKGKDLAVACGGAAIYTREAQKALRFLQLYEGADHLNIDNAESLITLTDSWIRVLIRDKKFICHGLNYYEGCCQSALDMIQLLGSLAPLDGLWANHMHSLKSIRTTMPHIDMAALARLSLLQGDSIELSLDYIAVALKCFDLATAEKERQALLNLAPHPAMKKTILALLQARFPYWDASTPFTQKEHTS